MMIIIKAMWDVTIQTDKEITVGRPTMVLTNKEDKIAFLIGIAAPKDDNIVDKHMVKVEKYQSLAT